MIGKRIGLWLARRELRAAQEHEAQQRASADHARDNIIPALEARIREAEARLVFADIHSGRTHQWAGRTTDRLRLGEK